MESMGGKVWALKCLQHSGDRMDVSGDVKIKSKVWK